LDTQARELRKLNEGLKERVGEQVSEIERMSRLRRFLPPQVADLIVTSGMEKQLESHRREITGSSATCEASPASPKVRMQQT
jgi:adenylate cyclase